MKDSGARGCWAVNTISETYDGGKLDLHRDDAKNEFDVLGKTTAK